MILIYNTLRRRYHHHGQFTEHSKQSRGPVAAGASHSRLFVGYVDDEKEPGGGVFLTKDSGSYSRVTYEFAKTQVNDFFWVDAKKPQPSKENRPRQIRPSNGLSRFGL